MSDYLVSESRVIAADPQAIFDIVADPAMHPVMDGSGTVQAVQESAPPRLELGATFGMDMKLGAPYKITNEVVEFEEGRRIAWKHFNGHVWRYLFEPVDGGTKVTEQSGTPGTSSTASPSRSPASRSATARASWPPWRSWTSWRRPPRPDQRSRAPCARCEDRWIPDPSLGGPACRFAAP